MANDALSRTEEGGLRKRLDEAEVLANTVFQLRKDLSVDGIVIPALGEGAFEALREQVLGVLHEKQARGAHAFGLVLNRVDLTEGMFHAAMAAGGLDQLAAVVVVRCLQKVLARERFAGRG